MIKIEYIPICITMAKMAFLWDLHNGPVKDILNGSKHRSTPQRIDHMSQWIDASDDPNASLQFLRDNIDSPSFHPFADPWENDGKSMADLFNLGGNKIVRLSTRAAGYFTISHTGGIAQSKRIKLTPTGLALGAYRFANINDLIKHLDTQECCICLENIVKGASVVLKCGHIFHKECIYENKKTSMKCPMCKKIVEEDTVFDTGTACLYMMHDIQIDKE
jgi:hypothetical protein